VGVRPDDELPDPVDPDVDLHVPAQLHELDVHPGLVLAAIAAGGVLGSEARYALGLAFPEGNAVPWTTLGINVAGCLLMGVLMVVVRLYARRAPLLRPFAAVGLLGGFTTFSAYAVGVERLLARGDPATALLYLALTPVLAVAAVGLGHWLARAALSPGPRVQA
jgi:CrcB protein